MTAGSISDASMHRERELDGIRGRSSIMVSLSLERLASRLKIVTCLSSLDAIQGRSNKEIARSLAITPETVKSHVKNIFNKLDVQKSTDRWAAWVEVSAESTFRHIPPLGE